jgi:hypothetical protein
LAPKRGSFSSPFLSARFIRWAFFSKVFAIFFLFQILSFPYHCQSASNNSSLAWETEILDGNSFKGILYLERPVSWSIQSFFRYSFIWAGTSSGFISSTSFSSAESDLWELFDLFKNQKPAPAPIKIKTTNPTTI